MARPAQDDTPLKHKRHAAYATETAGLLLIAVFILAIVVIGFWRDFHWSLR